MLIIDIIGGCVRTETEGEQTHRIINDLRDEIATRTIRYANSPWWSTSYPQAAA